MPFVMLRRNWPGNFRRTVAVGKKKTIHTFTPGTAVDLDAKTLEALAADIGVSLMPCELDVKGRPRMITDDVITETDEEGNDGQDAS